MVLNRINYPYKEGVAYRRSYALHVCPKCNKEMTYAGTLDHQDTPDDIDWDI